MSRVCSLRVKSRVILREAESPFKSSVRIFNHRFRIIRDKSFRRNLGVARIDTAESEFWQSSAVHGRPQIIACCLFDSFAAGSNRRDGDLDLAFLLAAEVTSAEYGTFKDSVVVDLGRLTRLDGHPIIMNGAGELVLEQLYRQGICVYQGNEETLRDFRRKKLPLIAEFAYYRDLIWSRQKQRYGAGGDG